MLATLGLPAACAPPGLAQSSVLRVVTADSTVEVRVIGYVLGFGTLELPDTTTTLMSVLLDGQPLCPLRDAIRRPPPPGTRRR